MNKINIGIAIKTIPLKDDLEFAEQLYDICSKNDAIQDVSIFYCNNGVISDKIKCGCFPMSNVMDFSGALICKDLEMTIKSSEAINDINIYAILNKYNFLAYNFLTNKNNHKINYIAPTKDISTIFERETTKKANFTYENLDSLVEYVLKNER